MRAQFLGLLAPLALIACGDKGEDSGGDTDTYNPEITDSDGDGLVDADETALGTDINNPDTDGDGHTDGEEVADGTNPLYEYSHSYTGGWVVGNCEQGEPTPTGPTSQGSDPSGNDHALYQVGDIAYNFTFQDQYEDYVSLFSFCGVQTMLVFLPFDRYRDAKWRDEWEETMFNIQYTQEAYKGFGFQVVMVLLKDYDGNDPEPIDAKDASAVLQNNPPVYPVLALTSDQSTLQGLYAHYEADWAYPTFVHLDPYMKVLNVDQGLFDPCQFIDGATCQ